jgi:YVTN family beta-propeller protein
VSELPTGAVTFLFTDIEGSTQLVKELRERWGDALAEHQALLRAAIEKYGGREIDTQGDAFFIAFSSARNAVHAAIEAQRALDAHDWPDGARLRVRMGIHTGQAAVSGERYLGLAVHRAARICAAAHGGQVLVSQTTIHLLEDEEQELGDIVVRDLGEQRLKDLDRPVRLYQLAAPDLVDSFPPPRTVDTAYAGREGELADAAEAAIADGREKSRALLIGAAVVALAAAATVVFVVTRSSGSSITVAPNSVGIIDPADNKVVAQLGVGRQPTAVAAAIDAVWVANAGDRTLSRIDPTTRTIARTVPLQATPTGIAVARDALWVANGLLGSLARVDTQISQLVATVDHLAERSDRGTVAVGEGGVWFASGTSTVARISPATNKVVETGFAGGHPSAVATGAGSVWVANDGSNDVSEINPRTATPGATITVGHHPSGVCVGDGAVWVANEADDSVTRIDPEARSSTTIPVGDGPAGIACVQGVVWVANGGDGTVSRIDTGTRKVDAVVRVGNHPRAIAAGAGTVWVAVQGE